MHTLFQFIFRRVGVTIVFTLFVLTLLAQNNKRPNILFIAVDDLRPELGCYGESHIHSPNIDALATSGIVFNRAYCNVPVCGASRASLLSGIRPNRTRFLEYYASQDEDVPGVIGLPMHFKNNGYHTISLGKIYHHKDDAKGSWSEEPWYASGDWKGWQSYVSPESHSKIIPHPNNKELILGPSYESVEGPDHLYPDGQIASKAILELNKLNKQDKPFFLAVGFIKPHLPFNAPKKYWDLYDYDKIQLPSNMQKPVDAPEACMHNFGELRGYTDVPAKEPIEKEFMRKLIHGYYACVSYTDAQIGKVVNELEKLGLAENTIVVLWGDHGWHLGEHNLWCKHCNFEKVLHAPLIVKAPGKRTNVKLDQLVEYVDIYPTLCELTETKKPFHLQGKSFSPIMENPNMEWKEEVYCRWLKGETIITKNNTYTEWTEDNSETPYARMLFDLDSDPEETINLSEKEENKELIEQLQNKLKEHIKERDLIIIP